MRVNINGLSQVKCAACGKWIDWHIYYATDGKTGVGIGVEPCEECLAGSYMEGVSSGVHSVGVPASGSGNGQVTRGPLD